jgi:hypothetical protein
MSFRIIKQTTLNYIPNGDLFFGFRGSNFRFP